MKLQEESLPPLDASLLSPAPVQRWHSVSRRSDLRPLGNGRSHRLLLTVTLGVVVLLLGGGGAFWLISQSQAASGRVPVAQEGDVARITPVAPTPNPATEAATPEAQTTPEFHVVQTGEVLSTIASKYNTTIEVLAKLNNIENVDSIRVGQRLRLVPAEQ